MCAGPFHESLGIINTTFKKILGFSKHMSLGTTIRSYSYTFQLIILVITIYNHQDNLLPLIERMGMQGLPLPPGWRKPTYAKLNLES